MPVSLLALSAFAIGTTEFVIMGLLPARLPRKLSLVLLMVVFIIGNLLCAMAVSYNYLTLASVLGVPIGT